jgi:hypothetical protein
VVGGERRFFANEEKQKSRRKDQEDTEEYTRKQILVREADPTENTAHKDPNHKDDITKLSCQ